MQRAFSRFNRQLLVSDFEFKPKVASIASFEKMTGRSDDQRLQAPSLGFLYLSFGANFRAKSEWRSRNVSSSLSAQGRIRGS